MARIPAVARQNGFQGLIPLDDIRSTFVFDDSPVLSPTELDDQATELGQGGPSADRPHLRRTIDSIGSMSLEENAPTMSRNPSLTASDPLRLRPGTSSVHSGRSGHSVTSGHRRQDDIMEEANAGRAASPSMSGKLPEDDGMRSLRKQLHQIREMALSTEEKAKAMHDLMMADYKAFKTLADDDEQDKLSINGPPHSPTSLGVQEDRHRSPSPGTAVAAYNLQEEDLHPTYRPACTSPDGTDLTEDDGEPVRGCKHYMRNVKVQCNDCRKWYTCRYCHDEVEKHLLVRKEIKNMLCMLCSTPQPAAEYCRKCNELTAVYFCGICKLWDNDPRRRIYHCPDCGICRVGEGLGKDYVHCKKCNVCINIAAAMTHRCVERATECDCPICGEWMFSSAASVVAIKCGHYIHRTCYDAYMQTSYKCPICNRSAVNMELQWRKLDRHIEAQPMPSQFLQTRAWIGCNDCTARSITAYHWLGNKCAVCGSYNTNEMKIVDSPADQEARAAVEAQRLHMATQVEHIEQHAAAGSIPMAVVAPAETAESMAPMPAPQQHNEARPDYLAPSPFQTLLGGDIIRSPDNMSPDFPAARAPPPPATPPHSPPRGRRPTIQSNQHFPYSTTAIIDDDDEDAEMSGMDRHGSGTSTPLEEDDAEFWGERITSPIPAGLRPTLPTGWTMRRVSMPSIPSGYMPSMQMPTMPNMPTLPNMPSFPTMPAMPNMANMRMPSIPAGYMPTMQMPTGMQLPSMPTIRGLSPSGWNVRSMSIGSLPRGMRSPKLSARARSEVRNPGEMQWDGRREREDEAEDDEENDDEDDDEDDEDDDDDQDMDDEDEEDDDGDVDDMALFGHR